MNCETAFEASGNPRAGLLAAQAAMRLRRTEDVAGWAERLSGTPQEASAARLAGDAFFAAGDLSAARAVIEREYALRVAAGDAAETARTAYKLAFLGWKLSDYRAAFDYAEVAYREALDAGDTRVAARTLEALHAVLLEIGDLASAERALDEALALSPGEAVELRLEVGRGLLYLHAGRPRIARAAFEALLAEGRDASPAVRRSAHENLIESTLELGDVAAARRHLEAARDLEAESPSDESLLLALEAKVEAAEGRPAAALDTLDRALAASPSRDRRQEMLYDRGRVLERLARPAEAEAAYRAAIELIEESRASVGADDFKEWLLAKRRRPYESLLSLQVRDGRIGEALATVESIKARTLLEAFLRESTSGAPAEDAVAGSLAARGGSRLEALQDLLPALRDSPVAEPRPVEELLRVLAGRHVLVFLEVGAEIWRFDVLSGETAVTPLDPSADEIDDRVGRLLSRPDDRAVAARLADELLADLDLPPAVSRLEIVADGALGRLPFGILWRDGRYLVEDHEIGYAPSLTVLAAIESRPWAGDEAALVLADPLGDLPAAAAEGREVARLLGATLLVGSEATLGAMQEEGPVRLLHLATHSSLDRVGPSLSLADGEIRPAEILRQRADIATVVLATCASASRRGHGIWGSMGGAFLAAGSRSVLASLWSIDDRQTRDFVMRFYREGGMGAPLRALTAAQRAAIAAGESADRWAPFVLLGATQPVAPINAKGGDH